MAGRHPGALPTIARDTLREAVRGRWLWLTIAAAAAVVACAAFARALALTEANEITLAVGAPLARLAGVLIVVLTTVASMVRERAERTLHLALAAPVSRPAWALGKALGFAAIAALTALLLAWPLVFVAPPRAALVWTASLVLELVLVAAVTQAIAGVLGQVAVSAAATLAFYALGRLINVILLLGLRADNYSELDFLAPVLRTIGAVVPRLDLFTRTQWLVEAAPGWTAAGVVLLQAAIFTALALCVAAIDLRRSSLD